MNEVPTSLKIVVLSCTAVLGGLIVGSSIIFLLKAAAWSAYKDVFDLAVTRTLLPLFTTLVTAALTYIFGGALMNLAEIRLQSRRGEDR